MKYKLNQEKKNGGRKEFLFTNLKILCTCFEFLSSNMYFNIFQNQKILNFLILTSDFHFIVLSNPIKSIFLMTKQ